VGRRWERRSQQVVQQLSNKITYQLCAGDGRDGVSGLLSSKIMYILWAGDGRDGVGGLFCSYRARSRTFCGREMGETESANCFTAIEQDHVLSVGGRWESRSQRGVLQLSSKITNSLWARDGRNGVSVLLCSYLARSRTLCGRTMGERGSACCSAAIQQDHEPAVGEMGEKESAGCSAAIEEDHILPVGGRWERRSQRIVVQLSSKITNSL